MLKDSIDTMCKLRKIIDRNTEKNKKYRLSLQNIKDNTIHGLKELDTIDDETLNLLHWDCGIPLTHIAEALGVSTRKLHVKAKTTILVCEYCGKEYKRVKHRLNHAKGECQCRIEKRIREEKAIEDRWKKFHEEHGNMWKEQEERIEELRTMPYHEYLQTQEWKDKSYTAKKKARFKCQLCGKAGDRLNTHHNTYENRGNELPSDLLVLCEECHRDYST